MVIRGGVGATGAGVLLASVLTGCKPASTSPAPAAPPPAPAIAAATGQGDHKGLPDSALTPGERSAKPNKRVSINPAVAKKVLESYRIAPGDPRSEVCRLIPPELGGTNNPANLFVTTPWFAGLKARLDEKLVQLVASKRITPEQAEADLKTNWVKASHKYYVRNYGEGDAATAKKKEDSLRW
jgi:hypothetical protein